MDDRAAALRAMRICRFCLTEKDPLSNIYERDTKNAIPLPLQIMACVAIEVFSNDGMPQLICDDCRLQTRKSYSFKTMCKRSDDALKLYLATGVLTKHDKEEILQTSGQKRPADEEEKPSPQTQKKSKPNEPDESAPEKEQEEPEKQSVETKTEAESPTIPPPEACPEDTESTEPDDPSVKPEPPKPPPKQVITHCFPCNQCERSFPLQQLLDIHMRQHTRERKFTCYECGKRFFSKHDLSKHAQTHSGEKPYACVVCEKTFSRATLLHRHEKIHVSVPKYLCTYCDKTYLSSEDLDVHMMVHKKKRPFKCDRCDKSFAFKQGLDRHEAVHNSENPYKCNYCEESFTTAGKLARHVTSHAGARPYPCKLCPRTFLLSHHLTRHLRNHYNRKSAQNECGEHKCDVCSMSFRRKDSLVNHTAIHSMVNLKCMICNKEFTEAKTVKDHVTTHLSGLPFPCDKCDYSFETQEELEDHEIKHVDYEEDEYIVPEGILEMPNSDENPSEDQAETPRLRRSQRESKIKNYADFLKDELGTDSEENTDEPEEEKPPSPPRLQIGSIQPVIRSETIKVYKGKDRHSGNTISCDLSEIGTSRATNSEVVSSAPGDVSSSITSASGDTSSTSGVSRITPPEVGVTLLEVAPSKGASSGEPSSPIILSVSGLTVQGIISEGPSSGPTQGISTVALAQQSQLGSDATGTNSEGSDGPSENVPPSAADPSDLVDSDGARPPQTPPPLSQTAVPVGKTPEKTDKSQEPMLKSVTKITTLENLGISKQALDEMTEKSGYVEMKVGQKVIRVQKLMMTKAMAKQGKLEMKGSTIVLSNLGSDLDLSKLAQLNKTVNDPLSEAIKICESKVIIDAKCEGQVSKTPVRTYIKKIARTREDMQEENGNGEELIKESVAERAECTDIDLCPAEKHSTSIKEEEILGSF